MSALNRLFTNRFALCQRRLIVACALFRFVCIASHNSSHAQSTNIEIGATDKLSSTILQNKPNRIGMNMGAISSRGSEQPLKNLIGYANPGFEPLHAQQIWTLTTAGTETSFTIPDSKDGVPSNYWQGGTFSVVESQSRGAELGCTGTIASNTGPNYPLSGAMSGLTPEITISSACDAPFSVGDIVILSKSTFPTPESWWEDGGLGGTTGTVRGGAKLLSDTTDLCATCGTQALNMNAAVSGS